MKVIVESPLVVRIDPHDDRCGGSHDIMVLGFQPRTDDPVHVTLTWGSSALLSIKGTTEFAEALMKALHIASQMQDHGAYHD